MALLDDLNWRHATKAYDPTKKISPENLTKILEAARLAPTSSGLQQFRVLVIESPELKEKLRPGSLNPECIQDCSHVLVFAAWDSYTPERIDDIYSKTTDVRNQVRGRYDSYTNGLKATLAQQNEQQHFEHAARQSYIALGMALAQAAELKIDSTPAEGFDNQLVDEVLNLKALGLKSVTLLYLGYSDPERDWLAPLAKARNSLEEFAIYPQN